MQPHEADHQMLLKSLIDASWMFTPTVGSAKVVMIAPSPPLSHHLDSHGLASVNRCSQLGSKLDLCQAELDANI